MPNHRTVDQILMYMHQLLEAAGFSRVEQADRWGL